MGPGRRGLELELIQRFGVEQIRQVGIPGRPRPPCACEFFKLPAVVTVVSDNKANKNNEDVVKKLKDVFSICFKNTKNCSICAVATSPGLGTRHWQLVAANLERGGLEKCGEMTSDEASPFSSFFPFLSLSHSNPPIPGGYTKKNR